MTVHTDILSSGYQDEGVELYFGLADMIAIYYNQFNIVNLSIVSNNGTILAYITYDDEGL